MEIDAPEELLPNDKNIQKEMKLCEEWIEKARKIGEEKITRDAMVS